MARLSLCNVGVELPIFSASSYSLRNTVVAAATGGLILRERARYPIVSALRDINVELEHGDRLALIGHNGSGKSTLLRVMAGIYQPTTGTIERDGVAMPIFEMFYGMDPEATGYENILMRGLALGMTRREIKQRAREIADFAELGEFISMPMRTYSTGMAARLAFAITTAIEPDILLIDEGIGAGDAAFVEKADRRLNDMLHKTSIVVIASHSEALLRRFCTRGLVLNHGALMQVSDLDSALERYANLVAATPG